MHSLRVYCVRSWLWRFRRGHALDPGPFRLAVFCRTSSLRCDFVSWAGGKKTTSIVSSVLRTSIHAQNLMTSMVSSVLRTEHPWVYSAHDRHARFPVCVVRIAFCPMQATRNNTTLSINARFQKNASSVFQHNNANFVWR